MAKKQVQGWSNRDTALLGSCRVLSDLHHERPPQPVAPVHDVDLLRKARQVQRVGHGRVAPADHRHGLAPEERAVARGAVGYAAPGQLLLARQAQRRN